MHKSAGLLNLWLRVWNTYYRYMEEKQEQDKHFRATCNEQMCTTDVEITQLFFQSASLTFAALFK